MYQSQAMGERRFGEIVKRQPGQGPAHRQRGDQQRQREDVRRGAAEGQQVVEPLREQPAVLRPAGTRGQGTPVVIDVGIIREDQRQDVHQRREKKQQPDLAAGEFFVEPFADLHAGASREFRLQSIKL